MLEVIQFEDDGRFGIRNAMTGVCLTKKNGKLRTFRTAKGAQKYIYKCTDRLMKAINDLNKK